MGPQRISSLRLLFLAGHRTCAKTIYSSSFIDCLRRGVCTTDAMTARGRVNLTDILPGVVNKQSGIERGGILSTFLSLDMLAASDFSSEICMGAVGFAGACPSGGWMLLNLCSCVSVKGTEISERSPVD